MNTMTPEEKRRNDRRYAADRARRACRTISGGHRYGRGLETSVAAAISMAISDARKECAMIADKHAKAHRSAQSIAAAIRALPEETT